MNAVRVARKAAGLSQAALSAALGVSQTLISLMENGRPVPPKLVPKLATLLNMAPPVAEHPTRRRTPGSRLPEALVDRRMAYVQTVTHFRIEAKLTVEELSRQSGVPRQRLSAMEAGRVPVLLREADDLAAVLGVPASDIQSGSPVPVYGSDLEPQKPLVDHLFTVEGRPRGPVGHDDHAEVLHELGVRAAPPATRRTAPTRAGQRSWSGRTSLRPLFGNVVCGWCGKKHAGLLCA